MSRKFTELIQFSIDIQKRMGEYYEGVDTAEQIISEVVGEKATYYDGGIDDGLDGDEDGDTYLMKACFSTKSGLTIRMYYGNNSLILGDVLVTDM